MNMPVDTPPRAAWPTILVTRIMRRESTGEERKVVVEIPLAAYLRGVLA